VEVNLNGYLIMMGCSWAVCCLLFFLGLRQDGKTPGRAAAVACFTAVLGAALGLLGAKLLLFLFRIDYYLKQGAGAFWSSMDPEDMSYYGGLGGVILAVVLAARLVREKPESLLDTFAPMGALMAALARFAEYFLGQVGTGYLGETRVIFPFAVSIQWDPEYTEYFLAVFFFEGVFSLIAAGLSFARHGEKHRFIRTLFYLCLPQILMESLRDDGIMWLFVHLEQLTCYLVVEGILVWYGIAAAKKGRKNWMPALLGLGVCALTVAEEFALDKTDIHHWITYACMAAGLALLAWAEHRGYHQLVKD